MKLGSTLAILLLSLVAVAHVLRLILGTQIIVGTMAIPAWVSVGGIVVPAAIAVLLWRERPAAHGD